MSQAINFNDSEEVVSDFKPFVQTGIHDFLVKDMYFQPAGDNLRGLKDNKGQIVQHKFDMAIIEVKVLKTHAGNMCEGAEGTISFFEPQMKGDDKDKDRINRLFAILVNMSPSDKKEEYKAFIRKLNLPFKELVNKLGSMLKGKNKTVRYKLVSKDGKGAYLPTYFKGFYETTDTPFSESKLKFDDTVEGVAKKDSSKTEKPDDSEDLFGKGESPISSANSASLTDDSELPF